jgi:hypothetical protein
MKENHVKKVAVNLTEDEYNAFIRTYEATTYRSLSTYGRKLLLGKPVTTIIRNRSLDDFIELAVKIRKELRLLLSKETLSIEERETLREKITLMEQHLIKLVDLCSQK